MDSPVTLRDLPATIVDLAGLSGGSPLPGRSLAAYWGVPASGTGAPALTTPAFSEQADPTALTGKPVAGLGRGGFQISLLAEGQHYIRDGLGTERLFDLRRDPFESNDLAAQPEGRQRLLHFRKMLLEFLRDNPASVEVENAYLTGYRQRLIAAHHDDSLASVLKRSPGAGPSESLDSR